MGSYSDLNDFGGKSKAMLKILTVQHVIIIRQNGTNCIYLMLNFFNFR